MANLKLERLSKVFAGGLAACQSVDLEVADGELLVLVGPSGSGKTTILRLIAGLEEPTSGCISIHNRQLNGIPARRRNVALVLQSHPVYPHWSVYKNLAFGLELREGGWRRQIFRRLLKPLQAMLNAKVGTPSAEMQACPGELRARVQEAARMLDIEALLERPASELSGGEEQRVALGRAVVRRPALFLLDEPLSNLDLRLRLELRRQLKELHARLAATMIYVTHDQAEALALADRIAVLNQGKIEQIGTPREVYECPANCFVAGFIGTSPMNFFQAARYPNCPAGVPTNSETAFETPGQPATAEGRSSVADGRWQLLAEGWAVSVALDWWRGGDRAEPAMVGLRPEEVLLRRPGEAPPKGDFPCMPATVTQVEYQPDGCLVSLVAEKRAESEKEASPESPGAVLLGKALVRSGLEPGEHIIAWLNMRRAHWFDGQSGRNLHPASAELR